jgi:hypothetical protein
MTVQSLMDRRQAHYGVTSRSPAINARRLHKARWGASALTLLFLLAGPATAYSPQASAPEQPPRSPSGQTELDVVTVEAQKQRKLIEHQISQFVSSITSPSRKESLGRWQPPICFFVAGLPRDQGEFIVARLSQVARDSSAPLAPDACKPNFVIVVTTEPERLLEKWWARSPTLFYRVRGIAGAKHFIHTDRPVRVWYNANEGCGDGAAMTFFDVGGFMYPSCSNGGLRSRLTWDEIRDIQSVIMVVDLARIESLSIGQLADYIAMTGLAEIREDAEPGPAPTILHLFGHTSAVRPLGLSSWDQVFLKALYTTKQENVMQLEEIELQLDQQLVPQDSRR